MCVSRMAIPRVESRVTIPRVATTRGAWVSTRGTTRDVYAPRYEKTWSTQTRGGMHGGATRDCTRGHAWKNEVVNELYRIACHNVSVCQ